MPENKGIAKQLPKAEGAEEKGTGREATSIVSFVKPNPDRAASHTPRVKICGLTDVKEALGCVELGASAIGCVFYPRSPRRVSDERAREICRSLPPKIPGVGVFVNETYEVIMRKVEFCGLRAVQLHGRETADLVGMLGREGLLVIKALFLNGSPAIADARSYSASAFLVECAGGPLPGGNALAWDWGAARKLGEEGPVIVAGGLNAENVTLAIQAASPDALDVSSGVESKPGRKDMDKVKRFLHAVSLNGCPRQLRNVFRINTA